ncbi:DUF5366 family protein, partial [Pueribacillus sp. YX66]|uniref:DUF5366 family protein n=1 Tax=Pueribacillus sp. YX66 TaxID=3229242 RepID=UPI00358D3698
ISFPFLFHKPTLTYPFLLSKILGPLYFPLLSILIFSFSFSLYTVYKVIYWLETLGLYSGLLEFFSETSLKLSLLFLLALFYFMLFSALKLIANTVNELALFFFSKDQEGQVLMKIRSGSIVFVVGSLFSLIFNQSLLMMTIIFLISCFVYFLFFLFKVSDFLTIGSMFGMVIMILLFWTAFVFLVSYIGLRIYNAILATLSI